MKKKTLVAILICTTILVVIGILTYEEDTFYNANAKVEIPITTYNFGTITFLDTIYYSFKIKNIGTESLIITQALPNCTCTVLEFNKQVVLPNNETFIKAQFIPNKSRLGFNSSTILVEGNFNGGITRLKLEGNVIDSK